MATVTPKGEREIYLWTLAREVMLAALNEAFMDSRSTFEYTEHCLTEDELNRLDDMAHTLLDEFKKGI